MNIKREIELDKLYHEILENLNKVYSHPLLRSVPDLKNHLSAAAIGIRDLRELKEEKPQ